jgi:glycosyltransferase involved in cell wall biosynthesis
MDSYLVKAINSVLDDVVQEDAVEVVLVVNGCNKDNISDKLKRIYTDVEKIIITKSNAMEISTALNEGIESSCGNILIRFDSDDIWVKGRFNEIVSSVQSSKSEFIFGTSLYDIIDSEGQFSRHGRPPLDKDKFIKRPFKSFTAHPAIFFSRTLFELVRYKPEYAGIEDVLFMHEILSLDCVNLMVIDKPLINYRIHEEQYTSVNKNNQKIRLAKYFHNNLFFYEKVILYIINKKIFTKGFTQALILSLKL